MKILVTSAKSNISKKIIMDLKKNHDVISTDVSGQNNHNFVLFLLFLFDLNSKCL